MRELIALLEICQATYQGTAVAWFEGDDDDAPGWRAYALAGQGADDYRCVGAPPRLDKKQAIRDTQWISWRLVPTLALEAAPPLCYPEYRPPDDWPGRLYGIAIEDCGRDSIFGMDIPEEAADDWCKLIAYTLGLPHAA